MQPGAVAQHPAGPSVLSRTFSALGWVMVASWLYLHTLVFAVDRWPDLRSYLREPFIGISKAAFLVAFYLSPFWVAAAAALILPRLMRKQQPAWADTVALILVIFFIGLYFFLVSQD